MAQLPRRSLVGHSETPAQCLGKVVEPLTKDRYKVCDLIESICVWYSKIEMAGGTLLISSIYFFFNNGQWKGLLFFSSGTLFLRVFIIQCLLFIRPKLKNSFLFVSPIIFSPFTTNKVMLFLKMCFLESHLFN